MDTRTSGWADGHTARPMGRCTYRQTGGRMVIQTDWCADGHTQTDWCADGHTYRRIGRWTHKETGGQMYQ